jgi:hypothetical protein
VALLHAPILFSKRTSTLRSDAKASESPEKSFDLLDSGARSEDASVASLRKTLAGLAASWELAKRREAFRVTPVWTKSGLIFGAGTVLAREIPGSEDRVVALLSAAFDKVSGSIVVRALERAHEAWRAGKKAESAAWIAAAELPPLLSEESARRLFFAAGLLDHGSIMPMDLRRICREVASERKAAKEFNPNQSRVPAGNADGGQWTSGGSSPTAAPEAPISARPHSEQRSGRRLTLPSLAQPAVTILRSCQGAAQACTNRYFNFASPALSACIAAYYSCMDTGFITIFGPGIVGQR